MMWIIYGWFNSSLVFHLGTSLVCTLLLLWRWFCSFRCFVDSSSLVLSMGSQMPIVVPSISARFRMLVWSGIRPLLFFVVHSMSMCNMQWRFLFVPFQLWQCPCLWRRWSPSSSALSTSSSWFCSLVPLHEVAGFIRVLQFSSYLGAHIFLISQEYFVVLLPFLFFALY